MNDCSTLKFQITVKCWKVNFLMPCKTKSCQSSTEFLRMLRALPPDTPRPPQFQPELWKNQFLWKTRFSRFTNKSLGHPHASLPWQALFRKQPNKMEHNGRWGGILGVFDLNGGWKTTGRRFRIDCPKFRRIWSRETFKSRFLDFLKSHFITEWSQRLPFCPRLREHDFP